MSRLANYDNAGLVSQSPETIYEDISVTSNFSNPQKNMVRHGGLYYHAFTATDGDADVYLRTSADGQSWNAPVQVNDDVPGDSAQTSPGLVVYDDGGTTTVVVSWVDRRATSLQLRTATSTDGGLSFAPSVGVSTHTDAVVLQGNIAADGAGRVYASWTRFDGGCYGTAWFNFSDDDGFDWGPMTSIYPGQCYSEPVHVIAGGPDSVMVVVSDDQFNHKNVIVLHSIDDGMNFTQSSASTYSITQSITEYTSSAVDPSGHVHLAFTYGETQGTASSINYTTSTDWGATWVVPVAVSDASLFNPSWGYDGGQVPAIDVAPTSGNVYIAWADQRAGTGDFDVYLSRSTDGGLTWDADATMNVLLEPHRQAYVSLAVQDDGGGNEHALVTWNDDRFVVSVPEVVAPAENWLYPTPAQDHITIDVPLNTSGPLLYILLDARGAVAGQGRFNGNGPQVVDVSSLRPGLYVMRLVMVDRAVSMPWVKE